MFGWLSSQTLEIIPSKFNGEIRVMKHEGRLYVTAGGNEQSGSMVQRFWKKSLEYQKLNIKNQKFQEHVKNVLILGLGVGSVVPVLNEVFPKIRKIIGVEIDHAMIEAGKKYFGLDKFSKLKIVVTDANQYLDKKSVQKYDLVLFDLYKGGNIGRLDPKFFQKLARITAPTGILIMNLFLPNRNSANALPKEIAGFELEDSLKVDYNRAFVFRKSC